MRLISRVFAVSLLLTTTNLFAEQFDKYKKIEAYEVRPGILVLPRYSADGEVCEIGIQKELYSPEVVRTDHTLSRKEIDEILEELVPDSERGPKMPIGVGDLVVRGGGVITMSSDFENVTVQIYSADLSRPKKHEVVAADAVAVVTWKHRKCR
jgi:hypothetical protein